MEPAKDMHKMPACALAHLADQRDSECLGQVLQNTISNLQQHHCSVEEIAAEAVYFYF